jgi:hypothetical protein
MEASCWVGGQSSNNYVSEVVESVVIFTFVYTIFRRNNKAP